MVYSNTIKYNYDQIYKLLKEKQLPDDAINRTWFAIYRGGLPLAHMLSIIYDHKDFGIIYPKNGKVIYPNRSDISEYALVIDDNIGTGNSLKKSYKLLGTYFYFKNIKSFIFLNDPDREIKPDFYCLDTIINGENRWIEVPWEEYD